MKLRLLIAGLSLSINQVLSSEVRAVPLSSQLVYQVSGQVRSQIWGGALNVLIGQAAAQAPTQTVSQHYQHQVILSSLYRSEDGSVIRAEWSAWRVEGKVPPEIQELLNQVTALSPTYVKRDRQGRLQFANPRADEGWKRQAIGSLLWPFQFVRPAGAGREWRVRESYPTAPVMCRYRLVRIEKSVHVYHKAVEEVLLAPEQKQMGVSHRITGYLQYRIGSDGTIQSVKGTLRERMTINGMPTSENEISLHITLQSKRPIQKETLAKWSREAQAVFSRATIYTLYAPATEEEQARLRAQSILGNSTPEQILQQLAQLRQKLPESPQAQSQQLTQLSLKLGAALLLHPDKIVPALQQYLSESKEVDALYRMVLSVLCDSDRLDAQKLMVNLFTQTEDREKQLVIARQISQIREPHGEVFNTLWKLAPTIQDEEVRKNLEISLSILARGMRQRQPALVERFAHWIAQNLEQVRTAGNEIEQIHWLAMAGNLGHPITLAGIEQLARSGGARVRSVAVDALRFQEADQAIPVIERLYPIEPDAGVRRQMVSTLVQWWGVAAARKLIEKIAFSDLDQSVRKACVAELANLAAQHQDALDMLVRIAENNSMPSIRREAIIALGLLHSQGVKVPPIKAAPP